MVWWSLSNTLRPHKSQLCVWAGDPAMGAHECPVYPKALHAPLLVLTINPSKRGQAQMGTD